MMFLKGKSKIIELTFNQYCLLLENLQETKKSCSRRLHIRIRRQSYILQHSGNFREGTVSVIFRIVGEGTVTTFTTW